MQQTPAEKIIADIADVGAQTRLAAERYETLYKTVRHAFDDVLARTESLADGALITMNIADAAANAIMAHLPNQPARDCRAGCDACCHLYVMTPPSVIDAIGAYLSTNLDKVVLKDLRRKLEYAADAAAAAPEPTKLRHRCPLLGQDGLCTIYEVRPPTCRAFTSKSAAACRSMVFNPDGQIASIAQNPSQFRIYVELTAALERAARARGLPAQRTGLAAGLLSVLPAQL